jgi:hypothetical protein
VRTRPTSISLDAQACREAAKELFNYTWTLLEKQDRSSDEDDVMINAAHASRLFWAEIGTPVHRVRGEWQISRVYATVGRPEPALHHAGRCLEICEADGIGGFDLAFAYEALARAHAVAGNLDLVSSYEQKARHASASISAEDDRELVLADLETLPR